MFFNSAKSYQIGWFGDAVRTVAAGGRYDGPVKGQVNCAGGCHREQDPVVVRIDVRDSDDSYYVGFNHRAKHNSDVPREFSSGAVF